MCFSKLNSDVTYTYSEFSEKLYSISEPRETRGRVEFCCLDFSDLECDLSEGCCHSRSRALSLLFGAVACIVVVMLLDG